MLQYRNKIISKDKRLLQARELAPARPRLRRAVHRQRRCRARARASAPNGVHLGKRRRRPGRRAHQARRAGSSAPPATTTSSRRRAAVRAGADYVAFGSVFPSPTKPDAVRAPLSLFRSDLGVPLCAIGGITLENAPAADRRRRRPARGNLRSVRRAGHRARAPREYRKALPMKKSRAALRARAGAHPRRRQLAGARVPRRRRHAAVLRARLRAPYLWDADGTRYIDYVGSWGPMLAGHAHPAVVEAVQEAASRALSFGAPTEAEIELAELLCRLVPSLELVRLVSSGTEATMTALRLARGFTGRSLIVKFEGCYHGHADSLLVKAGSGALTFGNPSSAGVPPETAAHTLVLDYNDIAQVRRALRGKRQRHRRRDRRAGRRQHEPRAARARLPRNVARGMHAPRRGARSSTK